MGYMEELNPYSCTANGLQHDVRVFKAIIVLHPILAAPKLSSVMYVSVWKMQLQILVASYACSSALGQSEKKKKKKKKKKKIFSYIPRPFIWSIHAKFQS